MEARTTEYSNVVADITGDGEKVSRQELFARQAVQAIPPFPELQVRLTRIFGPGPERDMLHQLIYWFGKPKMQRRWTLYKTFDEWHDERGLNRKQVDRARKRLAPTGIVEEDYGPYKRVHYRINWSRLQEVLEGGRLYPLKGGQSVTVPPKGDSVPTVPPQTEDTADSHAGGATEQGGAITTVPPQTGPTPHSYAVGTAEQGGSVPTVPPTSCYKQHETSHGNGEKAPDESQKGGYSPTQELTQEPTARTSTRTYFQDNSSLQEGANGFSSRPAPPQNNEYEVPEPQDHDGANGSRQASSGGEPELDAEVITEMKDALTTPDNVAGEAYARYRDSGGDTTPIMEAVVSELGFLSLSEEVRAHVREAIRELEVTA